MHSISVTCTVHYSAAQVLVKTDSAREEVMDDTRQTCYLDYCCAFINCYTCHQSRLLLQKLTLPSPLRVTQSSVFNQVNTYQLLLLSPLFYPIMTSKRHADPRFNPGQFLSYHCSLNGCSTFTPHEIFYRVYLLLRCIDGSQSANPSSADSGGEDLLNRSEAPDELKTICTVSVEGSTKNGARETENSFHDNLWGPLSS